MIPQSTAEHYLQQQRLSLATIAAVRTIWARMGFDLDASFAAVGPLLVQVIAQAQLAAARSSETYVAAVLAETGVVAPAVAGVSAAAFAGRASGGGDLPGLVEQGLLRTKAALVVPDLGMPGRFGIPVGASPEQRFGMALNSGFDFLKVAVQSEVADAERGATQTAMAVRPKVSGMVRVVNLPACKRCIVLAGRWYRWDADFPRHPGCDCRMVPSSEEDAPDFTTDPERALADGQVKGLRRSEIQALADGADLAQVVNASRKDAMSADGLWTREGTTRRGLAAKAMRRYSPSQGKAMRPTVDAIYKYATDREDAIDLLRRTGYIV